MNAKGAAYTYAQGNHDRPTLTLVGAALLTPWPTPTTRDHKDGTSVGTAPTNGLLGRAVWLAGYPTPRAADGATGVCRDVPPKDKGPDLPTVAGMAPRPTPTTMGAGAIDLERLECAAKHGNNGLGLTLDQAAPLYLRGPTSSGSPAPTASRGQLNPEFTRWLMGLPVEWGSCAPTETASALRKRRRSSGP